MSRFKNTFMYSLFLFLLVQTNVVHAHLMVAQHGTLNIVENSVFMTLSIPASAFKDVDDNGDGELSESEFNQHYKSIMSVIQKKVNFLEKGKKLTLRDMLLSTEKSHHGNEKHIENIIVMGRYILNKNQQNLAFGLTLFGKHKDEQKFKITVKNKQTKQKQQLLITAENNSADIKLTLK